MITEARTLDRIDCELLRLLQNDARTPNKALAERVGLAPSSSLVRVQRLVEQGVLTGFHAEVDPSAVGLRLQAMVFVQLGSHGGSAIEEFRTRLLALPEVVQLYHVGGAQDLLVHVVARDSDDLRQIVLDGIAAHLIVRHIETNLIFEHHRRATPVRSS